MASSPEISIPSTTISDTPKPYTIYNISIRLPLRSQTVEKRYSDFLKLHESLISQVEKPPPAPLPKKSWFSGTISNATFREERRKGLEEYIQAINSSEDSRWRNSTAWRSFLNLPPNNASTRASNLHSAIAGPGAAGAPITDPTTWLDCHRDVKTHLHDARLHLTRRDQASTPQKQHECSASAKSSLVRTGTLLGALEEGLKNISGNSAWSGSKLGEGELRRRKDLLTSARKEKDALEDLLNSMAAKNKLDSAVASIPDKQALLGIDAVTGTRKAAVKGGRVLGKETNRTRELDNEGVLQLQKQIIGEQDVGVEEIRKIIARQKELGIAINNELELQLELLNVVDEDAGKLKSKIDIAQKRAKKIS
ncbi:V-SNARE [Nannizzia gypsea CBS 118893]|uniref:V-SNARE n=1 Tax=Arthroderma gypseum (strain ATCC MYA-4604 / CBS 118893) TaxID=535722 RepID=E5R049_ARTGP|nr:V-SNARE [Nannizzia gypsea CBS 118893]EFQ97460.1 V-SNARE [Nannizzia gypsea CBS 118893]